MAGAEGPPGHARHFAERQLSLEISTALAAKGTDGSTNGPRQPAAVWSAGADPEAPGPGEYGSGPAMAVLSWGQCAACFIIPVLGPPGLALAAAIGALGWFGWASHPPLQWQGMLYGGLAFAGLALCWVAFAWRLRRLLQDLATLLPATARQPPADGATHTVDPDPCVRYVLQSLRAPEGRAGPAGEPAGPLAFLQAALDRLQPGRQGAVVIDTTGVILWVNPSLCQYFGYRPDELLQANVRVLMPQPYASQHDHFLRRHLHTGACAVLGSGREVPVLRRDGTQALVWLTVEDRTDPCDGQRRLFLGRMDFHRRTPAVARLQAQLRDCDCPDVLAFHTLDDTKDAMVAIAATGTVLYCNAAAARLFCWPRSELVGQNVKVLMPEPFASAHDGFLREYVNRDEQCRRPGQSHSASAIVGSGRDVLALARTGKSLRVFLAVFRLDVRSGQAADGAFLARLTPLPGPDAVGRQSSTAASQMSDPLASESGRAATSPRGPLPALARHRSTVVVLASMLQDCKEPEGPAELLLNLVMEFASQHRGRLNAVVGGQAVVTFNTAALPNSSHRSSAAAFMLQLTEAIANGRLAEGGAVQMAAVSRAVHSVRVGGQEVVIGEVIDLARALLAAQAAMDVANPVIDGTLHEELQYSYACRQVNRLVLQLDGTRQQMAEVFELLALKEASADEWMYQMSSEKTAAAWVH
eukprot:EG_transcript_5326